MELYKFYPFKWFKNKDGYDESYLIDCIKRRYVYFSDMDDLNDPFEKKANLVLEYVRDEEDLKTKKKGLINFLEEIYSKADEKSQENKLEEIDLINKSDIDGFHDIVSNMCNNLLYAYNNKIKPGFRVCCFTKTYDSLLMWGHYAEGMKGVCLKFDFSGYSEGFLNVKYEDKVQSFSFWDHVENRNGYILDMHSTKSKVWSYEKEVRLVKDKSSVMGYYDKDTLKEVIFGCKTSIDDVKEVFNAVSESGSSVKYKVAVPDSDGYGVSLWESDDKNHILETLKSYQNSNNLIHKVIVR